MPSRFARTEPQRTRSNTWGDPVSPWMRRHLRALPGIGKDLAAKIHELTTTGACRFHQELLEEFPPTILDILRLQGVGPKTVALLYGVLNIRTVDELAEAARSGRLRELKGMGAKKEVLILTRHRGTSAGNRTPPAVGHVVRVSGARRTPASPCARGGVHSGRKPAPRV